MVRLLFFTTSKTNRRCLSKFLKEHQFDKYYLKITLLTSPRITDVQLYHTNYNYETLRSNVMDTIKKLMRDGLKVTVLVDKSTKSSGKDFYFLFLLLIM